jgi:hypothetical protein
MDYSKAQPLAAWILDPATGPGDEFETGVAGRGEIVRIGSTGEFGVYRVEERTQSYRIDRSANLEDMRHRWRRVPPDLDKITAAKALQLGLVAMVDQAALTAPTPSYLVDLPDCGPTPCMSICDGGYPCARPANHGGTHKSNHIAKGP